MYERGGHVSQGGDGVVSVPWVLDFVRSRAPIEVEQEVRLGSDLPTRHQDGTVGREGRNGNRKACRGRSYLRRRTYEP